MSWHAPAASRIHLQKQEKYNRKGRYIQYRIRITAYWPFCMYPPIWFLLHFSLVSRIVYHDFLCVLSPRDLGSKKKVWIRVLLTAEMHRKTFLFTCLVLCRAKGQHNIYLENGNTNCQAILCTIACHQAYALNGQTLVWCLFSAIASGTFRNLSLRLYYLLMEIVIIVIHSITTPLYHCHSEALHQILLAWIQWCPEFWKRI